MIDYIKLLEQEPDVREVVAEVILKTIIADNPELVGYIYSMLSVGIDKEQIIDAIKFQLRQNKSEEL